MSLPLLRLPLLAASLVALVATGCGARTLLRDTTDGGPTLDVAPVLDVPSVDAPLPPPKDVPLPPPPPIDVPPPPIDVPPPPPIDVPVPPTSACDRATPIAATTMIPNQDTTGLVGTAPTCAAAASLGGAPLWYRVVVPSGQTLTVTAIASNDPVTRAPVVRFFDTCADMACVGGSSVSTDGRTSSARSTNNTATDRVVLIAVSSIAPGVGQRFTVLTSLTAAPTNVTCAGATAVTDGTSLSAQAPSSGVETQAPCPGQGGVRPLQALFYTTVVPPGTSLLATATAEGAVRSQPHVRIIPDCGANVCLAASTPNGGSATATYFNSGALPQRVVINLGSTPTLTDDRYTMTFRIRAPATNSACESATRVTNGTVLRAENLVDARAPAPWCNNAAPPANALYYVARVGVGEVLSVRATNTGASFPVPTLRLSNRCGSNVCLANSTNAGGPTPGGQLSFLNTAGAAQEVVLAVDAGFGVPSFPFDLAVSIGLPPYTVSRTSIACDDLTSGNIIAGAVGDDVGTPAIPLPVSFTFFGTPMTAWSVSTNGYLQVWPTLAGMSAGALGSPALPSTGAPSNLIAVFWDDLEVRAADRMDVRWQTVSAPSRHLTVQWTDVGFCCGGGTPDRVRFQAKLFEGTGAIELHYCSQSGSDRTRGSGASIGIQDSAGLRGVNVLSRAATLDPMTAFRLAPTP